MIFRCRMYRVVPEKLGAFNTFFLTRLLPVQKRYGAILVGRWVSDDEVVLAIWAYESTDTYHDIQTRVSRDPDSIAAQSYRKQLEPLFNESDEWLMTSTLPLTLTALAALEDDNT